MSGLFGSSLIKGTRITDFGTTTAEIGIPLPFGYGRAPYDGNVIFCPMPPVEQRHVTRQGKGGVKQESFTYSLSYSISFMKGQCYGWWWIKRNGKVVWTMDPNAPIEDQAYAQKWAEKVNFHYGTADQMPDAVIESYEGAGNVSAFRNLTYFTVEDDDVTDGGGAVPSYEACLIASPPEAYLTSHPYDQMVEERTSYKASVEGGVLRTIMHETYLPPEPVSHAAALAGGYLGIFLVSRAVTEQASYTPSLVGGRLKNAAVLSQADPEYCSHTPSLVGGDLRRVLVEYTNYIPERCAYAPSLVGGTLA